MPNPFKHCNNDVTPSCPLEATVYGYYPNIPWNIVYIAVFTICCVGQIFLGIRYKVKSYTWAVGLGCFIEVVGYGARVVLHSYPWDEWALGSQFIALAIAPAFLLAGIHLSLKHIMLSISPQCYIIRPKFYPWIFISWNAVSVVIQAASGAVASTANTNEKAFTDVSNIVLLVGICIQLFAIVIFGVMAGCCAYKVSRDRHTLSPDATSLLKSRQFRKFVFAMSLAYFFMLIRGAYRVGETSGGWKNSISRNQVSFMILDGLMCVLVAMAMTLVHPGIYFKAMSSGVREQHSQMEKNDGVETNDRMVFTIAGIRNRVLSLGSRAVLARTG